MDTIYADTYIFFMQIFTNLTKLGHSWVISSDSSHTKSPYFSSNAKSNIVKKDKDTLMVNCDM